MPMGNVTAEVSTGDVLDSACNIILILHHVHHVGSGPWRHGSLCLGLD